MVMPVFNYQPGTPEQSNPYANLLNNALASYQKGVQTRFALPMAQQALTKATQENTWNPQIWQSEIGLRGAQAGLANQEAKWVGPKAKAEIGMQNSQAGLTGSQSQMNLLQLDLLRKQIKDQQSQGSGGASSGQDNNNTVYGIPTPTPTTDDIVNSKVWKLDTFGPRRENAQKQQQLQYESYQKEMAESVQEAAAATNLKQAMSVFNNAMISSYYKGPLLGSLPTSGWKTAFMPGNLAPEQQAERAALQMLPAAITTLRDAMGTARFSNLDMNMSTKMKFDRTMEDESRTTQTAWIGAVNDRMNEKAKFYQVLGNPKSGAQKTQADMLWQEYQNNFPLINQEGDTVLRESLGNWPLYTTPKAIASIQKTGTYTPTAGERNTFMMEIPDGKGGSIIAPVKKGKVEEALRQGAKPV